MQSTEQEIKIEDELIETGDTEIDLDDLDDLFVKPVKKRKILVLSDDPRYVSGVGTQCNLLISGLLRTGKYTFRCLGGAIRHPNYDVVKLHEDWYVKPVDGFGTKEMIRELLVTEKPDAIFIFTDPRQFIWLWEMEDEIHQVCPITYWHIWDNDPVPTFNKVWFDSTDLINCISHKTYEMVKAISPEKTNYIPHAFPKEMYGPLPENAIEQLMKQNFQGKEDWYKVLWVNRNAHRKMPNDVLVSWKLFLEKLQEKHGHQKAVLIMHTNPNDLEGPNLLATCDYLKLHEHVWFSTEQIDYNHMNILNNLCDTMVSISKAEGHGLGLTIMLQTGKPIVALCTGGMTRQVVDYRDGTEHGVAIKPAVRSLVGSQNIPYIYEDFASHEDVANGLLKVFEMTPEEKALMKEKTIAYIDHEFNYNNMIARWDETLTECIDKFKEKLNNNEGDWSLTQLDVSLNDGAKQ